jgi:capsular polysaccharide biosynthesis protein
MAFVGLVLGASLHVLLPSKVTAVSKVYLVEPTNADPTVAITNDLNLLETRKVAEVAMGTLHRPVGSALITYKGSSEGTSILTIKATAASAAEAVAVNNAVAQAFLQVRAHLLSQVTSTNVATLQGEVQSLQNDIRQISAASSRTAITQQNFDIAQIGTLNQQIHQAQGNQLSTTRNSGVLDPAYVIVASVKKAALKDGLSGFVAGLSLGIAIVMLGELLSDRVRNRADVAAALGAPVELSVGRLP